MINRKKEYRPLYDAKLDFNVEEWSDESLHYFIDGFETDLECFKHFCVKVDSTASITLEDIQKEIASIEITIAELQKAVRSIQEHILGEEI